MSQPPAERCRKHVIVHGRVQGVWFRGSTERCARDHGVDGWVRNLRDGSVEAVFEGAPADVERVVAFCREGPRSAVVERIDVRDEPPEGESGFSVR